MRRIALCTILFATLAIAACDKPAGSDAAGKAALDDERQRVSYMVGLDLAKNVAPVRDEVDIDTVVRALRDAHAGKPALDDAAAADVRKRFTEHLRVKREAQQQALAAKNRSDGDAFLAGNAKRDGVAVTASGLQYQVLRDATGAKPRTDDTVRVNYVGTLLDGRKFEDTYAIDHPASFALGQVMPGLAEAIALMPVGGKYRFWLPSSLAYGERGLSGQIEPNATLVFEIELIEIAAP
jgi:FKBP-type peptidyl-prolyl cis-trans isomerase